MRFTYPRSAQESCLSVTPNQENLQAVWLRNQVEQTDEHAVLRDIAACHEAGHAVVAAHLRVPFQYATITSDEAKIAGHVMLRNEGFKICRMAKGKNTYTSRHLAERLRKYASFLMPHTLSRPSHPY
jgi:hypothetical protein